MELADAWLKASPRGTHAARAYLTEVSRLDRFLRAKGRDWSQLDTAVLTRFWATLIRGALHEIPRPPSTGSLDQSRRIISAFLRWMVEQGHAPVSVLAAVGAWRTPDRAAPAPLTASTRTGVLPLTELVSVSNLDAAAAALCYWAGATPQQLSSLAKADVDLPQARVTLTQRDVRRTVAIPRSLAKGLQPLLTAPGPWVFATSAQAPSAAAMGRRVARWLTRHGAGSTSARALHAQFQRHAHASGWTTDEIRAQLRRPNLTFPLTKAPAHRHLSMLVPAGR